METARNCLDDSDHDTIDEMTQTSQQQKLQAQQEAHKLTSHNLKQQKKAMTDANYKALFDPVGHPDHVIRSCGAEMNHEATTIHDIAKQLPTKVVGKCERACVRCAMHVQMQMHMACSFYYWMKLLLYTNQAPCMSCCSRSCCS